MKGRLTRSTSLGSSGSNSGPQNMMSALLTDKRTQEQWLGLTENQRQTILESVNMISAGERIGGEGGAGALLPFLMMTVQRNPGMTATDLVNVAKALNPPGASTDVFKGAIDLVKAMREMQPQQTSFDSYYDKFVKPSSTR